MIKKGMLSDYFEGVVVKQLSAVETTPATSNQHEFNGTKPLRAILGEDDRKNIPTRFIWLNSEQESIITESIVSWYDARRRHPTRTEYRLYYPTNEVTVGMEEGDTFFLATRRDETAMVIITPADSTIQSQLLWLFGIESQPGLEFEARDISGSADAQLDFAARYILDELGVHLEDAEANELDNLIEPFGLEFPNTRVFAKLAQDSLADISPTGDDPDEVLIAWLDREEMLFRRLERRIVSERLTMGFMSGGDADVDGFIKFSLSVQNRRKARAGQSLENHLETLFKARNISYTRGGQTENRHKPDFLFPSIEHYHDEKYPSDKLTMLGVKSTLKDRWRQVLTEAKRIDKKHLLTLEPAISENQTDQMKSEHLKLVLPKKLHQTYSTNQQPWLMSLSGFLDVIG